VLTTKLDISVIIPYHNEAETIRTTLDLLHRQTFPPKEVILVDSASTDKSYDIIQSWIDGQGRQEGRPEFINLRAGTNVPSSSKNAGVRISKNKYVAFMDCGLLFNIDWLEKQVRFMNVGRFEVVSGGVMLVGTNAWDIVAAAQTYGYKRFRPCIPSTLMKKSVFEHTGPFAEGRRAGYDVDWPNRLKSLGIVRGINKDVIVRYNGVNYAESPKALFSKSVKYAESTLGIHRYPYPYLYILLPAVFMTVLLIKPSAALTLLILYFIVLGFMAPMVKSRNFKVISEHPTSLLTLPLAGLIIHSGKLVGVLKGLLKK
jgi:glycosyltransferase involved in cell wall biosynthesis